MPNELKYHNDWSNITTKVMEDLESKITQLILDTVGVDPEGHCGIEHYLINLSKTRDLGTLPIPNFPDVRTGKWKIKGMNWDRLLKIHLFNLNGATKALEDYFQMKHFFEEDLKDLRKRQKKNDKRIQR